MLSFPLLVELKKLLATRLGRLHRAFVDFHVLPQARLAQKGVLKLLFGFMQKTYLKHSCKHSQRKRRGAQLEVARCGALYMHAPQGARNLR